MLWTLTTPIAALPAMMGTPRYDSEGVRDALNS